MGENMPPKDRSGSHVGHTRQTNRSFDFAVESKQNVQKKLMSIQPISVIVMCNFIVL